MLELVDGVGAVAISLDGGSPCIFCTMIQPSDRVQFCVWGNVSATFAVSVSRTSSIPQTLRGKQASRRSCRKPRFSCMSGSLT
jgi:hypothetical protein